MSYDYYYVRAVTAEGYDVNNPLRVDGESFQIYLSNEIEVALPEKKFKVICNDTNINLCFETELSSAEETTLTTTVNTHKNNS